MGSEELVGSDGHSFHMAIPNTAAGAAHVRKQFIRFVQRFNLRPDVAADLEAAVGEALANAAEHGYRRHGTIRVNALVTNDRLEASISDDGPGFFLRGPVSAEQPPPHSPRGYGLFLIRTLVDELEFRDDGKTVWFRKRLRTGEEHPRE
jgi:anti-sigma regulatory factor (Ser/Thr protein kinase)